MASNNELLEEIILGEEEEEALVGNNEAALGEEDGEDQVLVGNDAFVDEAEETGAEPDDQDENEVEDESDEVEDESDEVEDESDEEQEQEPWRAIRDEDMDDYHREKMEEEYDPDFLPFDLHRVVGAVCPVLFSRFLLQNIADYPVRQVSVPMEWLDEESAENVALFCQQSPLLSELVFEPEEVHAEGTVQVNKLATLIQAFVRNTNGLPKCLGICEVSDVVNVGDLAQWEWLQLAIADFRLLQSAHLCVRHTHPPLQSAFMKGVFANKNVTKLDWCPIARGWGRIFLRPPDSTNINETTLQLMREVVGSQSTILSLSLRNITHRHLEAMADTTSPNNCLQTLQISAAGAISFQLGRFVRNSKSLTHLKIRSSLLQDGGDGFQQFGMDLEESRVQSLELHYDGEFPAGFLKALLCRKKTLKTLLILGVSLEFVSGDEFFSAIGQNEGLRKLSVIQCIFNPETENVFERALESNTVLEEVDLLLYPRNEGYPQSQRLRFSKLARIARIYGHRNRMSRLARTLPGSSAVWPLALKKSDPSAVFLGLKKNVGSLPWLHSRKRKKSAWREFFGRRIYI
jgi:hypothetical protein